MDFDADLQVIHSALLKANNLTNYDKLINRGGNEEQYDMVVKTITAVLIEKNFLNANLSINPLHEVVLRKVTFFLVLNSDLTFLQKLVNNDDLEHLIWKAPEIPKTLLIHIVWSLKLDKFLCEIIQYSAHELALDLVDAIKEYMKYVIPEECTNKVKMIISSAYESLNTMFKQLNRIDFDKSLFLRYHDCILHLLSYFLPDSKHTPSVAQWKKSKRIKHEGLVLCNLIDLLYSCFKIFTQDSPEVSLDYNIYELTFNTAINLSFKEKRENMLGIINQTLNKLNQMMSDTFLDVYKNLTTDKFCLWFEISIGDPPKNLQKIVAEKAYRLEQLVLKCDAFDKEMILMLSGISQKPKALAEIIHDSDKKTICKNALMLSPEQRDWIEALVKHKDLFTDKVIMEFVGNNLKLFHPEDYNYIFENGYKVLKNKPDFKDLKVLLLRSFCEMTESVQRNVIFKIVEENPWDNSLQLEIFEGHLTTYFNKVVEQQDDAVDLYYFFIQNPSMFYERSLNAAICNLKQAATIMNLLRKLKICNEPLVEFKDKLPVYHSNMKECGFVKLTLSAFRKLRKDSVISESEKHSYLFILENMVLEKILDSSTISTGELLPRLFSALKSIKFSLALVYLEALNCIFSEERLINMLILCAVVIQKARWDLWNYSASATILLNAAIKMANKYITMFTEQYRPLCPEYTAVCRQLNFLTPMNRFHFRVLWGTPFDVHQFVAKGNFIEDTCALSLLLHCLTPSEMREIFVGLHFKYSVPRSLRLFCKVLTSLGRIVDKDQINQNEANSCFLYTARNVASILQDRITSDSYLPSVIDIYVLITNFINSRPLDKQEEALDCFMTVLSQILKILKGEPSILQSIILTNTLANEKCREILERMLKT